MSQADRDKWDNRYKGQQAANARPSALLEEALARFSRQRGDLRDLAALDLACGAGRNSLLLARHGCRVDAVDISSEALALGARRWKQAGGGQWPGAIRWLQADLDDGLPPGDDYDLIAVIRFLDLALLRQLSARLNPGGMLVAELHMNLPGAPDTVSGPGNPDFLAAPGALAGVLTGLEIWQLEEGIFDTGPGRKEALARFIGVRPGPGGRCSERLNPLPVLRSPA
jgi:SAM-dependent methyltransferase